MTNYGFEEIGGDLKIVSQWIQPDDPISKLPDSAQKWLHAPPDEPLPNTKELFTQPPVVFTKAAGNIHMGYSWLLLARASEGVHLAISVRDSLSRATLSRVLPETTRVAVRSCRIVQHSGFFYEALQFEDGSSFLTASVCTRDGQMVMSGVHRQHDYDEKKRVILSRTVYPCKFCTIAGRACKCSSEFKARSELAMNDILLWHDIGAFIMDRFHNKFGACYEKVFMIENGRVKLYRQLATSIHCSVPVGGPGKREHIQEFGQRFVFNSVGKNAALRMNGGFFGQANYEQPARITHGVDDDLLYAFDGVQLDSEENSLAERDTMETCESIVVPEGGTLFDSPDSIADGTVAFENVYDETKSAATNSPGAYDNGFWRHSWGMSSSSGSRDAEDGPTRPQVAVKPVAAHSPAPANGEDGQDATEKLKSTPFDCTHCGKQFGRRYDLKRHITTVHEKVRAFDCHACNLSFLQRSHLNEHISSIHEKTWTVQCTDCRQTFTSKSRLKRHHKAVHQRLRPFRCSFCNCNYFQRTDLKKHLSVKHGRELSTS